MKHLREEHGFTVTELVIASGIFLILLIAVLNVLDTGTRTERGQQARHDALLSLRSSMTTMTKELRQATAFNSTSTGSSLDVQTLIGGSAKRIIYSVTGTELTRRTCVNFAFTATCGGTAGVISGHVTSSAPFCFNPEDTPACTQTNPLATGQQALGITLAVVPDVQSLAPITLSTEIELRNF